MNLQGKSFRAVKNSDNGSINSDTIMNFTKESEIILGNYSGGTILSGQVIAKRISETEIQMLYQGATISCEIQSGKAHAYFGYNEQKQFEMRLSWQWLTGDQSKGESIWLLHSSL